jgi:phage terminase large subunit GpA-like protein
MNCLASREYDAVVFVGPARTGKTIGLIDGWIVYNIVCDPADMLVIQVSEEKAREHSKKRLDRTFRCSPEVKSRLSPRRNDNNVHDRTFRAGNYLKLGWPSVNIMSSSDYKSVALTDYDRFPEDIDGEGDAFSLGSKRTTTFMSSGMTLVESSQAGTSATQNGVHRLRMKRPRRPGFCRCLTVVTAVAFTGRARIAGNIFSRKSPT